MKLYYLLLFLFLISCSNPEKKSHDNDTIEIDNDAPKNVAIIDSIAILVLGTTQDGGSPHAGCEKDCCRELFIDPDPDRMVVSLGIIDPELEERYIFDATPDLPRQMNYLERSTDFGFDEAPNGIFLTHAHIGHYAGLMHLGKEAMNADQVPVYAMPRMKEFLENNGPWSQLVSLRNIVITQIENETQIALSKNIKVIPFLVPHRDEYSETVGFKIIGPNKSALFIPDIDKWKKWDKDIIDEIEGVDYAFLDATFYDQNELKNRDMSAIPHPFVVESMELFKDLPAEEKSKVIFIHLNHTNPLLNEKDHAWNDVISNGFHVARKGEVYYL